MAASSSLPVRGATARVRFGDRTNGDMNADLVAPVVLAARQQAMVAGPWTWLREVHGAAVVTVDQPGTHAGDTGDALVTRAVGAVLGIWVGDCAPVALVSPEGVIGAVHAGWRGVAAGVLPAAVGAMHDLGAREVVALVGPHLHAPCYEFGRRDLARLAEQFGPGVVGTTSWGTAALDLGALVGASLAEVGVPVTSQGPCTACTEGYWSHRARVDLGRQAMAVWLEAA